MMDDVILAKKESLDRCIHQIRTYYALATGTPFEEDFLRQDAILLNIQRACEQCISVANHVVKVRKLGIPKDSRDGFKLLAKAGVITDEMARQMGSMVGLRNIAVHDYQDTDISIIKDVIENHLDDLTCFVECVLKS